MILPFEISKVTLTEINQLQEISTSTFVESFSAQNTAENMNKYVNDVFSTNQLSLEVSNPNSEFYFVTKENQPIGYLKLNFSTNQNEVENDCSIEIERIYLLKEFQGKKIGQLLLTKAISIAKEKCASHIWLGVWEKNEKAIQFYQRYGFTQFNTHIFRLGDDEQTDLLMRLDFD